jgi:predicted NUDIX family NTP pyrophosphohydrolase
MAKKQSAGLLVYRRRAGALEIFLVHPGGPFWAKKDAGAWSIPKGEFGEDEEKLTAAQREFREETGLALDGAAFLELVPVKQAGGKLVFAWAVERDLDAAAIRSDTFALEWPPRAGPRRRGHSQQHLRPGMAAQIGPDEGIPGNRPGRLVCLAARPR